MSRKLHTSLSVEGALAWEQHLKGLAGNITVDGKTLSTKEEVRAFLEAEKAKGHKLLPMSKKCDNHDWERGCMCRSVGVENG